MEWNAINWGKTEWAVFKLQKRIYRASKCGDVKRVRKLQNMLVKSWYARLLAVRRVTQENKGKNTAGVDGVKTLDSKQRIMLARNLEIDGKASPTRRVWIPKPGKQEMRPLSIPTMKERAKQALMKLALEPEWEARFESASFGFRPGRGQHDAIEAIRTVLTAKPKYALDADISQCFDRIDHQKLLAKINTTPQFQRQIKAWLKAGVMDGNCFQKTESGCPQGGGVASPLLANIALHGMQQMIEAQYPAYSNGTIKGSRGKFGRDDVSQPKLIRYADDLVLLCDELRVVEHCRQLIEGWLEGIGLELKPEKTRLVHTLEEHEGQKPGFNFLGFTIRQFKVGKHHSGKTSRQKSLGFKTIITPSNQKVKEHYEKLAEITHRLKSASQSQLIWALNPVIRGWCNYQSPWNSGKAFNKLNYLVWRRLWRWAKFRHPNKGHRWIARKYWRTVDQDNWTFMAPKDSAKMHKHSSYRSGKRWRKVQGTRSPYDGDEIYWSSRLGDKYRTQNPQKARLLKRQQGRCTHCHHTFKSEDHLEMHHLKPFSQGGSNKDDNLVLVHLHCHDQLHSKQTRNRHIPAHSHK